MKIDINKVPKRILKLLEKLLKKHTSIKAPKLKEKLKELTK